MIKNIPNYVIGIDGGGTKTVAVLANLEGKILAQVKTGPSNPYKIELNTAIFNIKEAIRKVLKGHPKENIAFIYIGLAGGLGREKGRKKELKEMVLKQAKLSWISKKKLIVETDQLNAFRSGTDKKDGVVLISGTGSIAAGWRKGKEARAGGWEYVFGDSGSGYWLGEQSLRAICRQIDGRGSKTQLTNLVFKEWNIKKPEDLPRMVYKKNLVGKISSLAFLIDEAAEKGDKIAKNLLIKGGKELSLAANQVIKRLKFQKEYFPLVLIGGVFNSKIYLSTVKKEIKKLAPKVEFIRPKEKPIIGAIKLAIENTQGNGRN